MAAFAKFESLLAEFSPILPPDNEGIVRTGIAALHNTHARYTRLMRELAQCTKKYEQQYKAVQPALYKSIRKMNAARRKTANRTIAISK